LWRSERLAGIPKKFNQAGESEGVACPVNQNVPCSMGHV